MTKLTTSPLATDSARIRQLKSWRDGMQKEFDLHRADFLEMGEYLLPRRCAIDRTLAPHQEPRSGLIHDSHATHAINVSAAGLMSGLTDPTTPWYELTTAEPALMSIPNNRRYIDALQEASQHVLNVSNVYEILPLIYKDKFGFGTGCGSVEETSPGSLFCTSHLIGSYLVACDHEARPVLFYTKQTMSVAQIISRFGMGALPREIMAELQGASNSATKPKNVQQVIYYNDDPDPRSLDATALPVRQTFFLESSSDGGNSTPGSILHESGFHEFPIVLARPERIANSAYGNSPGFEALPPARGLQVMKLALLNAMNEQAQPPVEFPFGYGDAQAQRSPGAFLFRPAGVPPEAPVAKQVSQSTLNISHQLAMIDSEREAIDRAFSRDLFRMITELNRSNVTATEVAERVAERDSTLAPLLQSLSRDLLEPIVNIAVASAMRAGMVDAPPPELAQRPLRVKYVSTIARAQERRESLPIRAFIGWAQDASQTWPEVLDAVDVDEAANAMHRATGASQSMLRDQANRDERRQARQQALAAQQQLEQAESLARAARDASTAGAAT